MICFLFSHSSHFLKATASDNGLLAASQAGDSWLSPACEAAINGCVNLPEQT